MSVQLRPYQREAFSVTLAALRQDRFVLLQAATGTGKTILFSALIRHCVERFGMRVGILAHREVLVRQAYEKLLHVWPEGESQVGFACKSVSQKVDLEKPVLIASPQTLISLADTMSSLHLLIIDECHRVPPKNEKSQYRALIEQMEILDPALHVLGVTATPFRLGHGFIYGDECRTGATNWWESLHSRIGIGTLQQDGFLVPIRAKEAENIDVDLAQVRTNQGEFNTKDLSGVMERAEHVGSAVSACQTYAQDRKHIVVFAVTIQHAETLTLAFQKAGYTAGCVHSHMKPEERQDILARFASSEIQLVCNVGVLTEGWDAPEVDCMLLCRPTLSPALYVQMVGRGLRPSPGKQDCLILDLSGNCMRHGNPDDPLVPVPSQTGQKKKPPKTQMRKCPECRELLPLTTTRCPVCGYSFARPELVPCNKQIRMRDVLWEKGAVEVTVTDFEASSYQSKAGNTMFRLTLRCTLKGTTERVSHYLDLEGQGSKYGRQAARALWEELAKTRPPRTVEEAMNRRNELHIPPTVILGFSKKGYIEVARW